MRVGFNVLKVTILWSFSELDAGAHAVSVQIVLCKRWKEEILN